MSQSFKRGDAVSWETSQGETHGTVEQKLTSPTDVSGHHAEAPEADPQYLVKSDKTGKLAAHKPEALKEG